jgi:hypothetical protein
MKKKLIKPIIILILLITSHSPIVAAPGCEAKWHDSVPNHQCNCKGIVYTSTGGIAGDAMEANGDCVSKSNCTNDHVCKGISSGSIIIKNNKTKKSVFENNNK